MRWIVFLWCFFLVAFVHGETVGLLLVHSPTKTETYPPTNWVQWPPHDGGQPWGAALSVFTGLPWQSSERDATFETALDGHQLVCRNYVSLRDRGYFNARTAFLGSRTTWLIANPTGRMSLTTQLIACEGSVTQIHARNTAVPPNQVILYEAQSWADLAKFLSDHPMRAMVVEMPSSSQSTSRCWFYGRWPGVHPIDQVPGLLRAHRIGALLLHPRQWNWSVRSIKADQWIAIAHRVVPYKRFAFFVLIMLALLAGAKSVQTETVSPVLLSVYQVLYLYPASLLVSGNLCAQFGRELWTAFDLVSWIGLVTLNAGLQLLRTLFLPNLSRFVIPSLIGLVCFGACDWRWWDWSSTFTKDPTRFSPELFSVLTVYLLHHFRWVDLLDAGVVLRRLTLAGLVAVFCALRIFTAEHPSLLAALLVPLLVEIGAMKPILLGVLAVLPTSMATLTKRGVLFKPQFLVDFAGQSQAINYWPLWEFVSSPLLWGCVFVLGFYSLLGERYLVYRIGRTIEHNSTLLYLPWLAAGVFAVSLTDPELVAASIYLAIAGCFSILDTELASLDLSGTVKT